MKHGYILSMIRVMGYEYGVLRRSLNQIELNDQIMISFKEKFPWHIGNQMQGFMINSQKLWPIDQEDFINMLHNSPNFLTKRFKTWCFVL